MTDILLRKAQAVRAGARGDNDYDVIGTDGTVIGRIFEATTSPIGTPWMWTITYGDPGDRTLTHGYETTRQAAMQGSAPPSSSFEPSLRPESRRPICHQYACYNRH